ncbi:MAG: FAD-dependent monooxygenase [Nocardioides sp.]|uniref:FAD-dependent monooxygenase n=1 Tax=Nocardioides sp. TaxID=35761 RepID=UPI0039E3848E
MPFEAHVVVVGAGPVGTSLAIDAAMRGLNVVVIEQRAADDPADAKCNTIAARTMETFRRFGIADEVRAAGLPSDYPTDTLFATSLSGPELTRIKLPSRAERQHAGFVDSEWPSPERMVRQSQLWLEPILRRRLLSLPNVRLVDRTSVTSFSQDEEGVTARCIPVGAGAAEAFDIRASFLVGCDGGASTIRKQLGVRLVGDAEIARTRTTLINSSGVRSLFGERRPAWMTWVANHNIRGNVVAIDGQELWLVHRALPQNATDFTAIDLDQSIRDVLGVDGEFDFEIVRHEDWIGRRLVASRFRDGRVFLAGDAAHLWVPYAGYGMNAGIADATHLAWLLSAVLRGWGHEGILDAYEAERLPITDQVSRFVMAKMEENSRALADRAIPKMLSSNHWPGRLLRRRIGARIHAINVEQMAPEGLNFGYFYDDSPIIIRGADEEPPAYSMGAHTASTIPGCRVPHFIIDGVSIIDLLGPDYTLLRFDPRVEISGMLDGALPMTLVDVPGPPSEEFEHALLIVRADAHIAWRGDSLPARSDDLIQQLRGQHTA